MGETPADTAAEVAVGVDIVESVKGKKMVVGHRQKCKIIRNTQNRLILWNAEQQR